MVLEDKYDFQTIDISAHLTCSVLLNGGLLMKAWAY